MPGKHYAELLKKGFTKKWWTDHRESCAAKSGVDQALENLKAYCNVDGKMNPQHAQKGDLVKVIAAYEDLGKKIKVAKASAEKAKLSGKATVELCKDYLAAIELRKIDAREVADQLNNLNPVNAPEGGDKEVNLKSADQGSAGTKKLAAEVQKVENSVAKMAASATKIRNAVNGVVETFKQVKSSQAVDNAALKKMNEALKSATAHLKLIPEFVKKIEELKIDQDLSVVPGDMQGKFRQALDAQKTRKNRIVEAMKSSTDVLTSLKDSIQKEIVRIQNAAQNNNNNNPQVETIGNDADQERAAGEKGGSNEDAAEVKAKLREADGFLIAAQKVENAVKRTGENVVDARKKLVKLIALNAEKQMKLGLMDKFLERLTGYRNELEKAKRAIEAAAPDEGKIRNWGDTVVLKAKPVLEATGKSLANAAELRQKLAKVVTGSISDLEQAKSDLESDFVQPGGGGGSQEDQMTDDGSGPEGSQNAA